MQIVKSMTSPDYRNFLKLCSLHTYDILGLMIYLGSALEHNLKRSVARGQKGDRGTNFKT